MLYPPVWCQTLPSGNCSLSLSLSSSWFSHEPQWKTNSLFFLLFLLPLTFCASNLELPPLSLFPIFSPPLPLVHASASLSLLPPLRGLKERRKEEEVEKEGGPAAKSVVAKNWSCALWSWCSGGGGGRRSPPLCPQEGKVVLRERRRKKLSTKVRLAVRAWIYSLPACCLRPQDRRWSDTEEEDGWFTSLSFFNFWNLSHLWKLLSVFLER